MIGKDFAAVLARAAAEISAQAELADKPPQPYDPVARRAGEAAFVIADRLMKVMRHAYEDDTLWLMVRRAAERKRPAAEQARLRGLAEAEAKCYEAAKEELEAVIAKVHADQESDPLATSKAESYFKAMASHVAKRQREREARNEKARARRDAAKAAM